MLCMSSANERRRYNVTSSPIGQAHYKLIPEHYISHENGNGKMVLGPLNHQNNPYLTHTEAVWITSHEICWYTW